MSEENLYIRIYTDPILHKKCEPVTVIDDALVELAGKMLVIMRKNRGVGLSANQIGVDKQFCVVNLDGGKTQLAMINPKIIEHSKKRILLYEGCLSAPKIFPPSKRYDRVVVQFQDFQGEVVTYEMTDMDARIIQHEIDHLNGKTVVDNYIKLPKEFTK